MIKHPSHFMKNSSNPACDGGILSEEDLKILWVARTLTSIELQCEAELFRIEKLPCDESERACLKGQVLARFRERREPYVSLLKELRSRRHRSFAA